MNITEKVRGALRRVGGRVSAMGSLVRNDDATIASKDKRRTVPLPSILNTYGWSRAGSGTGSVIPKATPFNLRRFAETPIARRAINCVKDRIAGMAWRVQPRPGRCVGERANTAVRVQA